MSTIHDKESTTVLVDDPETSSFESDRVEAKRADNTLAFMEEHAAEFEGVEFTEEEKSKAHRALYIHLVPLILVINTVLFMDKATLSYSSILGLFDSTHIDDAQYDDTNSLFYTGYAIGELLNFVLQKMDTKKFMTITLFIWTIIIFLHCTASNFGGLVALRFFLGFFESVIVPALEVTMFQFFTPQTRATLQPIFWTSCVGFPIFVAGFIAYGVLHITNSIPPWKIFMIINGGITLIITLITFIWYPSDPTKARFLTTRQKYLIVKEVQETSSAAVSQDVVKKYQIIECLKDPVSWLFVLFVFFLMLANNLTYQQNLLYVSLGVSNLGTTLASVAGGAFSSLYMLFGAAIIHFWPGHSAVVILIGCIPSFASGIAMITIPWDKKLALVAMLTLGSNTYALGYIVGLGWSTATAAGNTKRFVRHFMFMVSYAISNIVSPQLWKGNQAPRYYAAWSVQIVLAWTGAPIVAFVITAILKSRNKKRLAFAEANKNPQGTVTKVDSNGKVISEKVPIANLDLTDKENKYFIYPL